jgi:hypothetical protein
MNDKYGPGKKYDSGKLRWDLLPLDAIEKVVEIMTFGSVKYGDNNWQNVKNANNRYTAALLRHFCAHRKGEKLDQETKLLHLSHMACNAIFLLWMELNNKGD